MRILHTADWHLADRLKQIDRTTDLQRAVQRIADYCDRESVDVLLIAGDLFSELARPEALQASLAHLSQTFRSFLMRGGTIVAIAGNHDNDIYCETLRRAFQLAAPNVARPGDLLPNGRFYLITKPVHFRLCDSHGLTVQFVCMPYPTTSRYLHGSSAGAYSSFAERCQLLRETFIQQLQTMRRELATQHPRVLVAHVNAISARPNKLFRGGVDDDIIIDDPAITSDWTYAALGHLHGSGSVHALPHVRYSGSIERLGITEKDQRKSVVLVTLQSPPSRPTTKLLPLPATPFYDICITDPRNELPRLRQRYPDASLALVRCHIRFHRRDDNLYEILTEVARVFPRCYERTWSQQDDRPPILGPSAVQTLAIPNTPPLERPAAGNNADDSDRTTAGLTLPETGGSIQQLVLGYLANQLADDVDRQEILSLARQLLEETE